ncbi:hypothetical protein BT96DRAFT_38113 [Gymnopus androsaceus JB14]|uniref:NB-ARC domain-containing protein n=1 Tax=Gymnopus androsaceus JB14 TaxID=1447944 RepID=A0A6A4HN39_9AGAR|nr:hypothetical protein BT96DRAFT_38113 [Gymnopus androsaceus JB14]
MVFGKEIKECKEEWEKAKEALIEIESMMAQFQSHQKALTPSPIVQRAFQKVEHCLQQVREASKVYLDINKLRKMAQRNALKNEAVSCVASINNIQQYFQTYMIFGIWEATISKQPDEGQVMTLNVLRCPTPAAYFIGREDTLKALEKIFTVPVVTISGPDQKVLDEFVRHLHKKQSTILLDATSADTLAKSVADKITQNESADILLVLQNAQVSVAEEYLHTHSSTPILISSTQPAISSLASSTACAFELPDHADQQVVKKLLNSIKEALDPRQHVVTIVANGGAGKTQAVLKFVSKNKSRFSNIWLFDATSNQTLTSNFKELAKAAGIDDDVKNVRDFLARSFSRIIFLVAIMAM